MNYIIIMAGGVGSRFWPASTEEKPKQFLDILGIGKSLLRHTYERFAQLVSSEHIYVVTNERYRDLVAKDLPELRDHQILGEPSRNNTGPCVAYSAFKLEALDPEANLVLAPADHFIAEEAKFLDVIRQGLEFTAREDAILTLGMQPNRPATGYGYIELGSKVKGGRSKEDDRFAIFKVEAFKEKPDELTAKAYIRRGNYVWNSGLFLFRAKTILEAFETHASQIYEVLQKGRPYYNTPGELDFLKEWYPQTENISVDYAIMERAANIYCQPAEFGWTDLGSWKALRDHLSKDASANIIIKGKLQAVEADGNLVSTGEGKQVIIKGLSDYMVIDENNTLLIFPLKDDQEIKKLVNKISR